MAEEQKPKKWKALASRAKAKFKPSSAISGQQASSTGSRSSVPPTPAQTNAGKSSQKHVLADGELEDIAAGNRSALAGSEPEPATRERTRNATNTTGIASGAAQTGQRQAREQVVHTVKAKENVGSNEKPHNTAIPSTCKKDKESSTQDAEQVPDPTEAPWYHSRTPEWNAAVKAWKRDHSEHFSELAQMMTAPDGSYINGIDSISRLPHGKNTSKEVVARLKRWLPVLAGIRGFVQQTSKFDPHSTAPAICAMVFFGIDILFNIMSPEDRDTILNLLCQCGTVIKEGISFEMNFTKRGHPAASLRITNMDAMLQEQYGLALRLIYTIKHSCRKARKELAEARAGLSEEQRVEEKLHSGFASIKSKTAAFLDDFLRALGRKVTDEVLAWASNAKALERLKTDWSTEKKALEEAVAYDKNTTDVFRWFRLQGDPEPTMEELARRVMPGKQRRAAGLWFTDSEIFAEWCAAFQALSLQSPSEEDMQLAESSYVADQLSHRVLWLRGGYGTGKTTLLYHTYQMLKYGTDITPIGADLRVIRYFCDAVEVGIDGPTHETMIRGLTSAILIESDHSLSQLAQSRYSELTAAPLCLEKPDVEHCEQLFEGIVKGHATDTHYVLVIDALDECRSSSDQALFLIFMKGFMARNRNISLLCSSHQHVPIDDYLGGDNKFFGAHILRTVDLVPTSTASDVENYIDSELERRKPLAGKSIFYCKDMTEEVKTSENDPYRPLQTTLLSELRRALVLHAQGMFKWVQIWLDIMIPIPSAKPDNANFLENVVERKTTALDLLKQLKKHATDYKHDKLKKMDAGYKRLWDQGLRLDLHQTRERLFHFVLAAYEPLSSASLTEFLRSDGEEYDQELTIDQVCTFYANFLIEVSEHRNASGGLERAGGLRFVHASAKGFLLRLRETASDDGASTKKMLFAPEKNHMSFVKLYMDVIGSVNHPYWQATGIDAKNWKHFSGGYGRVGRLGKDIRLLRANSVSLAVLARYLIRRGIQHCDEVVKNTGKSASYRSLEDPIWCDLFYKVILNPESAFGLAMLAADPRSSSLLTFRRKRTCFSGQSCLREVDQVLELLISHVMAYLSLSTEDTTVSLPSPPRSQAWNKGSVQEFLSNGSCIGGGLNVPRVAGYKFIGKSRAEPKGTALQIACDLENTTLVRAVLEASRSVSDRSVDELMCSSTQGVSPPIGIAIARSNISIVEMLLEFEVRMNNGKATAAATGSHSGTSRQWLLKCRTSAEFRKHASDPQPHMLHLAANIFSETEMRHLLHIALPEDHAPMRKDRRRNVVRRNAGKTHPSVSDIHPAPDRLDAQRNESILSAGQSPAHTKGINMSNNDGRTLLHMAVQAKRRGLIEDLVEIHGADVDAKDREGRPPGYGALTTSELDQDYLTFLREKGITVDFTDEELQSMSALGKDRFLDWKFRGRRPRRVPATESNVPQRPLLICARMTDWA